MGNLEDKFCKIQLIRTELPKLYLSFFLSLSQFDGKPGELLRNACAIFASNQTKAEKLIKEYSARIPKFKEFIQVTTSSILYTECALCKYMYFSLYLCLSVSVLYTLFEAITQ